MTNISHTLDFNNDTIELDAEFHGDTVHITVESEQLGMIEDSTASSQDYSHMLDASPKELAQYILSQLAFYAYHLAENAEEDAA